MANQFEGMSAEIFSYEDFEITREKLVQIIHAHLTQVDKNFLLSVKNLTPDWSVYDFEKFPAVQWKMRNLQILKDKNSQKHREQYDALKEKLDG